MATGQPGLSGMNAQHHVGSGVKVDSGFAPTLLHLMVGKYVKVKPPNHRPVMDNHAHVSFLDKI